MSANPIPPLRHREPPREPIPFPHRRPLWQRVLAWTAGGLILLLLLAFVTVFVLLHNGRFHNYMLVTAEQKLSAALGAQVQARSYTLTWSGISPTVDMYGVVIHGAPPYADPPLLTADHLHAEVQVTSLLKQTWYLNNLTVDHPVVRVFFDKTGATNLPASKNKQSNSQTDIFSLGVRHLQLSTGELYYNDRKSPLEADLHDLIFQAGFDPVATKYSGTLSYRDGHLVVGTFRPIPHALDAGFSATRETFTLDHAALHSGNSIFNLQATITDYSAPKVDARYDATVDAGEVRYILRNPSLPTGIVKAAGTMKYANPENRPPITAVTLNGQLSSGALTVRTPSFTGDIRNLAAQYSIANGNAVLSNIRAAMLGGQMTGDLNMRDLAGNTRSTLHAALRDLSLAALKSTMATSSPSLRQVDVRGGLSATADAAWGKTMDDLVAHADATLNGSLGRPNGETIPMNGVVHARYAAASQQIALQRSFIRTPQSSLTLDGAVSNSSSLNVTLDARDLRELETIANLLRPPAAGAQPLGLAGSASFIGSVRGSTAAPQIAGQLNAANLRVRGTTWRLMRATLNASPSQIRVQNGELDPAPRGRIAFDLTAALNHWAFTDVSPFNVALNASHLNLANLIALSGQQMQAAGTLDLRVNVHGTERAPFGNGTLSLANAKVSGYDVPGLHSDFQATGDRVHATLHADIPHATANATLDYLPRRQDFTAQLQVAGLRLEDQQVIKSKNLGIAGVLNLTASGQGNIHNPTLIASLQMPQLSVRGQQLANVDLRTTVANHVANFTLGSQAIQTSITGRGTVQLVGDYNSDITLDTQRIPLAPLVAVYAPSQAGNITGQTELHATIHGPLKNKQALDAHLVIPVLTLAYKNTVQLGAQGPIRVDYVNGVATLEPMHITGTGTDLQAHGTYPVTSNAPAAMTLLGSVDLKLAELVSPDISSSGQLRFNIDSAGRRADQDVQGRIQIVNANFASGEIPLGLQNGNGVLVLTKDRINIESFKGVAGGGEITATGGVLYRPGLQFSLGLQGNNVRILYQDAIRTGINANLALAGTPQDAVLRGNVEVEQLQFTPDFDLMDFMGSLGGGEATPPASEGFANNLRLEIGINSGGGVHMVSRTLSLEGAANLRVNGTAQAPVILGRINLNGGDLIFMGNRYKLEGGTVDFVDPNRTKPVLDASVSTTVQQYDIQMHFWGPADHLHTNYSSDPSLPPSDIINLIAFGKTTEATEANPTPPGALGAESLVASQVSSQITSRVEKFAGISQLSIDPVLGGNQQNPGAHIAVQQRVTSKIFVTFATDVTSTQNQVIKFEYQVGPRLSINAVRDQNGGFAVDTKIHKKW